MTSVQTYRRPSSLEEAWRQLNEGGKSAKLVGGGIDVALYTSPETSTLIDLALLPTRAIEWQNDGLAVGSGVTLTELLESPLAADYLDGIVVSMLRQVASPLLRNAATVGGTLASTHPWSDVITLFVALDARVTQYAGALDTQPLIELLKQRGTMDRAIITEVKLPAPKGRTLVGFEKFVRTGFDVAMLNCACLLTIEDHICTAARIVFGGTPDIAHRLVEVEETLLGSSLESETVEAAGTLAAEMLPARDDIRASAAYRRILAGAGVRRCLHRIVKGLGE